MANITVNISRTTGSITQAGYGKPLIMLTSQDFSYKEYASLSDVLTDFANTTVAYKMAAKLFGGNKKLSVIAIAGKNSTTPSAITTELNKIILLNDDWFFLVCDIDTPAMIKELDTWIQTQDKEFFTRSSVMPASYSQILTAKNTAMYYHKTENEYPECAVIGEIAPYKPGKAKWANKKIPGVTPNPLNATEIEALKTSRWNTIIKQYGLTVTSNGFMIKDLFIDQHRSQLKIKTNIQENVATLMLNNETKIPYDDTGITQIVSRVEAALNTAFTDGIIASKGDGKTADFVVNAKTRAEIAQANPTAIEKRVLEDITFKYVEAGAIEGATIEGQVVVQI